MLTNNRCASTDQLQQYLSGDMSSDTQDEIAIHLERCSSCSDRLAQLAGSDTLWREAQEMLQEYQSDLSNNGRATDGKQSSSKKLSGIDAHLTHWMGPTDDPTKIGRIGPYEVIGIIGYGGAGVVLRAHDMRLNRPVAIKALLPALAHNPMARRRFERESRAVAAIVHQNVVPIFAVDVYNDHPYIAMQYVAGRSLQQRIDKEGALSVTEIVRIATQIAHALQAAHAQGIIHRDIKPANILLESNVDRVYVTDFGLARVADDATTHSGMVTGTPQYMSPEQCHGNSVDCRSDLFSLGSVMYAMCTGHPPFRSETLMGMLRKVCDHQPRSIRDANPDIPDWLESLVFRLLNKSADERFTSASELSLILERELAHLNNPTTVPIPPRDWIPATIEPIPTPVAIPFPTFSNYFNKGNLMIASVILLGGLSMFLFQDDGDASAGGGTPAVASSDNAPAPSSGDWTLKDADKKHPYYESKKTETAAAAIEGTLTVKLNGGHVSVKAGTGDEVTVEATEQIHAATPEAAQKLSDTLQLRINSDKKNVEVTTAIQPWHDTKEGEPHYKSLELIITVPTKYSLNVDTNGGHVSVTNTTGNCELLTKGGHLNCEHVKGDVVLTTQGGHIEATDISGKLDAKTAGGHIKLEKIGGSASAQTKGGHLVGKQIGGDATVGSYGGHIELDSVAGNIELTSQGGNIDVKKVAGKLVANANSGNVHIEYASPIKGESNVTVGSGDVHIRLPKDAAANIQAVVNHGSFHLTPEFKSAKGDQQTAIISSSSQVSSSVKTKVKVEKSKPAKSKSDKAKGDKKKAKDDDDDEELDDKSEEVLEETAEDVAEENSEESTSEETHEESSQIISHKINGGGPAINVQLNSGRLSIEAAP